MSGYSVLHVVEAAEGGVARHLHDLCDGLLRRGHRCSVAYSPSREDAIFRNLREMLAPRGVTFARVPMQRGVGLADWRGFRALRTFLHREAPSFDILHAHSSKAGALLRLSVPKSREPHVVYTPHAFYTMNPLLSPARRVLYKAVEKALANHCGAVIAVSAQELDHARSIGLSPRVLNLVPNGIAAYRREERISAAQFRLSMRLPEGAFLFAFVGRFVPQKAPDLVLDAFLRMTSRQDRAACHLLLAGDGPMESELKDRVRNARIEHQVHFPGRVEGRIAFLAADAAVQPSAYESFGYVFLEAMNAHIPLVATRTGIAGDLAAVSGQCTISPSGDSQALAERMNLIVENAGAADFCGVEGYSIDDMTDSTVAVYGRLVPM